MSELEEDPRETQLHPRFEKPVVGHDDALERIIGALNSNKPHHAWLISGPKGIGKATLAYMVARRALAKGSDSDRTNHLVFSRSHPDFFVLELSMGEGRPARLKTEITLDDVHRFTALFSHTSSSGGWRVGLIDCVDDLNREGANALLKLVEEPPNNSLLLIVNHLQGKVLKTLKSRCLRLHLSSLNEGQMNAVLSQLPLEHAKNSEEIRQAISLAGGSPGRAIELFGNEGAEAFARFLRSGQIDAAAKKEIASCFANRQTAAGGYRIFMDLMLDWLSREAAVQTRTAKSRLSANTYSQLQNQILAVEGYNLDRRVAVIEAISSVQQALKAN